MSRGIPPLEERRAFTHPVTLAQIEGQCKPDGDCMVWQGSPRLAEHPSEAAV